MKFPSLHLIYGSGSFQSFNKSAPFGTQATKSALEHSGSKKELTILVEVRKLWRVFPPKLAHDRLRLAEERVHIHCLRRRLRVLRSVRKVPADDGQDARRERPKCLRRCLCVWRKDAVERSEEAEAVMGAERMYYFPVLDKPIFVILQMRSGVTLLFREHRYITSRLTHVSIGLLVHKSNRLSGNT